MMEGSVFEEAKQQHHQTNPELDSPGKEKMKRRPNRWRRDLEAEVGQLYSGTHLLTVKTLEGETVLDE